MSMYCPGCGSHLSLAPMAEPGQHACVACQRVWRIRNVIEDAARGLTPARASLDADIETRVRAFAEVWGRSFSHCLRVILTRGLRDAEMMGVCRDCGCTSYDACDTEEGEPCHWVEDDLCSRCAATTADTSAAGGRGS